MKVLLKYLFDLIKILFVRRKSNNLLFFGYEDSSSGASVLSLYMVKELSLKFNVIFVTPDKNDLDKEFRKCSRMVLRVPNRRIYKLLFKKDFKNAILNSLPACFDAQYLKESGFHIITLIHELHYLIEEYNMKDNVIRAKVFSDVIIFPSNFCYKSFEKHYGKIKSKVLIKPQGLFLTKNYSSNKFFNKQYIANKYGLDINQPIILMVGLGDKRKGMDLLFDICYLVKKKSIQFIHIGKVLDEMKEYCLTKYGSLPENFLNVDYISDSSELFKYYDAASVLLMLSREEPFGSVVLEAFSASTPVIGFANSGGYNDIVIDGFSGYLIDYLDVERVSSVISSLVYEKEKIELLGNNGKQIVDTMTFAGYISFIEKEFRLD